MEKIIARQLIKKTDTSEIIGYELLVQSDAESLYNSSVDSAAANAMTAFLTENSSKIFRDRKTFGILVSLQCACGDKRNRKRYRIK